VPTGQMLQLSANVDNSTADLIWEVNGTVGGDSTVGTIASSSTYTATYTAPPTIPPNPSPFTATITAVLQTTPTISTSAGVTIVSNSTFTGVYSWRNDNSLTGQNAQETMLTPSTVTQSTFGKLLGCSVDGQIYAQPLYVANVSIAGITHNVVYVATEHDSVYAFDADNLCNTLWQVSFINPAMNVTTVPATDIAGQTDIVPEIGITGTPVIDLSTGTLYVAAKTKVIENGSPVYMQQLHALDLTAGAEKFDGPVVIQATVAGTGDGSVSGEISFHSLSLTENQRSALLLAGGNVYVAFDSYGDTDPFHGWLFAYNAANLQAAPMVFITTPNGSHGGIGESGAAPSLDASGNIFAATSDGTFDASTSGSDYAETLLKMQINAGAFNIADSFTPSNELTLNISRKYFGSTGVLLLPGAAGSTAHPQLAITGDQAGDLYLLDRNSLATGGALQTLTFSGPFLGTPAYWAGNNTVYAAAAGDNLRALPLTSGTVSPPSCSSSTLCSSDIFALNGASPVISWDGTNAASGIVWALDTSGYVTSVPAILHAYDATNLASELYMSPSSGTTAAGLAIKFAVPTVANGKVYLGTQDELSVFGPLQ
jgi:hypothetical protein